MVTNNEIMVKLGEIRAKLPIDQFQLEIECMGQPSLYAEVGEMASQARADAKTAKEHLEYVRAEMSAKIRQHPEENGLTGKVTEGGIESAIVLSSGYQKAVAEYIEANRIADSLGVMQTSIEQRKSMIRDLVALYTFSYYSQHGLGAEKESIEKVTEEQVIARRRENAGMRRTPGVERIEDEEE
jgi:hypothetical protein